ncbi:hypothetical protein BB559_007223 [Furculomyces boomerangus]|uniref:Rhodanese domain-containing protein n=1 Tax=Furculomyces boomerangus TaxID=61424 RepID=A0A2T9XYA9_9FUNG|nr:hypothetical protein BB559_007223 [Furculomyces boomerangus]
MNSTNLVMSLESELDEISKKINQLTKRKEQIENELLVAKSRNPVDLYSTDYINLPQFLDPTDITKYSRQLLLPQIGPQGQAKLKNTKVIVVGAGGLGSSVLFYLCSMGIGEIGVIDHDTVDISNLHRQIIHTEENQGMKKVESAQMAMRKLNSRCKVNAIDDILSSENALRLFSLYDIVVDASDNLPTRYLVSDACVLSKKPLVFGSALRTEGQLVTYNHNGGPCYRCLFPNPPKFDPKASCSEAGVLGVVPGIIGCMQALEVVKILMENNNQSKQNEFPKKEMVIGNGKYISTHKMLTFSAFASPQFREFKVRGKRVDCEVCGQNPSVKELIDYPAFCGSSSTDKPIKWKILDETDPSRISCYDYAKVRDQGQEHVLLDVREKFQYEMCSIKDSVHIPCKQIEKTLENIKSTEIIKNKSVDDTQNNKILQVIEKAKDHNNIPIYAICRRGNLSQLAVKYIDPKFPSY